MTCCNGRIFLVRVMHVHNYSTLPFTQSGSNTDTAPAVQPFTARPGVALNLTECETPLHFFSVFMDDTAWNFLVEHTNQYAAVKLAAAPPSRRSLYSNWRDVTMEEMKAFVGVILNMGVVQLPDIRDYWRQDETVNLPFFRSIFSHDRFLQIFRLLHVGDIPSPNRPSKIEPWLQLLLPKFQRAFTPSKHVAVDESVITFKGRVSFRQYLKGKPNPWGIKAFVLADSITGYLCNVSIYYGKTTALLHPELPQTVRVVLTLVQHLHNAGYDLYVDRFYNSPLLALELSKVGLTVTGTVQSNRRGLPAGIKATRKQDVGTIRAFRSGSILALSWVDKRKILMLSTKHSNNTVQVASRR